MCHCRPCTSISAASAIAEAQQRFGFDLAQGRSKVEEETRSAFATLDFAINYDNLLYSCYTCNLRKGSATLPNPERHLTSETVFVKIDGRLIGLTQEAQALIDKLSLNSKNSIQWRVALIRIVQLAAKQDGELYEHLMGFPSNMPDLSTLKPPSNTRPQGIDESNLAWSRRGDLPDSFIA